MREIRLNAFDMACVGHIQHGMWTHPRDRSGDYTSLDQWVSLARLLERGLFDGLFLADILGAYDVYEDSPAPSLRNAVQIPLIDPMALVPAMASVSCWAVTSPGGPCWPGAPSAPGKPCGP